MRPLFHDRDDHLDGGPGDDKLTGRGGDDHLDSQLVPGVTVFDDQSVDTLKGSAKARDLFFANFDNEDEEQEDRIKSGEEDTFVKVTTVTLSTAPIAWANV